MHPERLIGPREEIAIRIVSSIVTAATRAIEARGRFVLAIAGGSVADAFLPALARAPLAWEQVHVFWCDERAVPLTDADSNAGHALALLIGSELAERATLHPMFDLAGATESNDAGVASSSLDRAARAYAITLETIAGTPPVIDFVLLGVGEDGHVASLFPGHRSLDAADSVLVELESPKPPPARLTLGLTVLTRARETVIAAFGDGKATAMHDALDNANSVLPVARVIRAAERVTVMLDAAAASQLRDADSSNSDNA